MRFGSFAPLIIALFAVSGIALAQPLGPGGQGDQGFNGPGRPGGMGGPGGMIRHMDTDGDGRVSQAEHQAATAGRFQKLDANGDGFVTADEFKAKRERQQEFQQKMQELRKQYQQ